MRMREEDGVTIEETASTTTPTMMFFGISLLCSGGQRVHGPLSCSVHENTYFIVERIVFRHLHLRFSYSYSHSYFVFLDIREKSNGEQ